MDSTYIYICNITLPYKMHGYNANIYSRRKHSCGSMHFQKAKEPICKDFSSSYHSLLILCEHVLVHQNLHCSGKNKLYTTTEKRQIMHVLIEIYKIHETMKSSSNKLLINLVICFPFQGIHSLLPKMYIIVNYIIDCM